VPVASDSSHFWLGLSHSCGECWRLFQPGISHNTMDIYGIYMGYIIGYYIQFLDMLDYGIYILYVVYPIYIPYISHIYPIYIPYISHYIHGAGIVD